MEHVQYQKPYAKLFIAFFSALMIAFVGFYAGQYVPPAYFLPLIFVELGLIIAMIFLRRKKAIGYPLMFTFMFVSGCTLYPAIAMYISQLGAETVGKAIVITALSFAGIALYTVISKHDFRFMGGFLFISLFVLIGLGIANIFVPFGGQMDLIYSGFGILVFVGYTLYDFSRLTHEGFTDEDIPMIIVSIYLDFVNLLLFVLRFLNRD
ncbi:Bax inhibitor-1 family protein [Salinibacillus aidingensis]|uniref:Bax inhibitor-1 family protein n=1 Tax=Salinibacillus aidingensis TaxID=237684 RepID=A0ABN1B8X4_9BACI